MFTKIKNFIKKVYDNSVILSMYVIGMLLSVSAVFIGLGVVSTSEILSYVGLGFALFTILYSLFTLVSPTHRKLAMSKKREELKELRLTDSKRHYAKATKQTKKEINAEKKAERL